MARHIRMIFDSGLSLQLSSWAVANSSNEVMTAVGAKLPSCLGRP
jgi:hypothetical protein